MGRVQDRQATSIWLPFRQGGPDGGIDLVLSRPGKNGQEKFLVQCKQWRAFKVGVEVVRELYGVMAARGATGGFVVTSGRFTEEAQTFAEGRNVRLVDGPKLRGLIQQVRAPQGPFQRAPAAAATPKAAPAPVPAAPRRAVRHEDSAPACPVYSKGMVRRTAKRGANAGAAELAWVDQYAAKPTKQRMFGEFDHAKWWRRLASN